MQDELDPREFLADDADEETVEEEIELGGERVLVQYPKRWRDIMQGTEERNRGKNDE